ncbi:MAG TPA: RidA family protein [Myxococcales bacterium]|nr:RidA family protein [Myxococcales bacterium]
MSSKHQDLVQPLGWARPSGYSNGVAARGRMVFVAGQIGWDPTSPKPKLGKTFAAQFDQALANAVEVVRAAGGRPDDLARITIYVSDKKEYLAAVKEVGKSWRRRVGRHYPAMTLVEVSSLLEKGAKVEIEATAVLPEEAPAAMPAPARKPVAPPLR